MIMNSETRHAESASLGMEETISMSIDTSDQVALMSILSENLYKDPIGSLIRESVSNALDTHKEAHNDDPIIVGLRGDGNLGFIFSVQDFGTGISPHVVNTVLSKYAASTKRNSNEYLGYYGLGFKAPLAYTDSFMFITKFEGIQYRYIMYKSEKGTKIDLVGEQPITDGDLRNGTKIEVQLSKRLDYQQFLTKIREQLAYFEGVYFDVPGIPNDFKIIKNEDWKYSGLLGVAGTSTKGMHICLDNVYYEIDWQRLGIPRISIDIGLNFKIEDGLLPIPSREDIKYTEEAKELIKIKIASVADYFLRKFNETRVEADSFEDIYDKFASTLVKIEEVVFNINQLKQYSYIKAQKPTLKGIKLLDLENLSYVYNKMFDNYEIRGRIRAGSFAGKWQNEARLVGRSDLYRLIKAIDAPRGLQLEYLKDVYSHVEFLYKRKEMVLGSKKVNWMDNPTYQSLLNLHKYPKSQWREVIKEFQSITTKILDKIPNLSDLQPTLQWLEERKAKRNKGIRGLVTNEEISLKIARIAERGEHKLTYDYEVVNIRKIAKTLKKLIIYGVNNEKEIMDSFYWMIRYSNPRVALVLINKYDEKKIKGLHNFISISEFMKGQTKPFKAFATAILIERLQSKNKEIFENTAFIEKFSKSFAQKINDLEKYEEENYPSGYGNEHEFLNRVLEIAEQHNLFDEEMMLIYNEVNEKAHLFNFVGFIKFDKLEYDKEGSLKLAREILKGRKFRMDWENYLGLNPVIEREEEKEEDNEITQIESEIEEEKEEEEEEKLDDLLLRAPKDLVPLVNDDLQF